MGEQAGKERNGGKDEYDPPLSPSALFQMVMQGCHPKETPARALENEHLQDHACAFDQK
jgi:hypothetical protein